MADDVSRIEPPLFQVASVKGVREVSPRPGTERRGRDTYVESDEVELASARDAIERSAKRRRRKGAEEGPGGEAGRGAEGAKGTANDGGVVEPEDGRKKDKEHLIDVLA